MPPKFHIALQSATAVLQDHVGAETFSRRLCDKNWGMHRGQPYPGRLVVTRVFLYFPRLPSKALTPLPAVAMAQIQT
jgi:hypothetical protein